MKYVFLAIFVLIASMPVQVSSCDMHDSQQTSQHGSHDMDHDGGMGMDCCDHDPAVPSDNCDSMFHCGVCTAGVMAFSAFTINSIFKTNTRLYLPDTGEPLSNINPPPFKPPIV
ncbi:MAG: hypothetical protein WBN06_13705 [Lysobacterales bacterium]